MANVKAMYIALRGNDYGVGEDVYGYSVFHSTFDSNRTTKADNFMWDIFYEVFTGTSSRKCTIFAEDTRLIEDSKDSDKLKRNMSDYRMWESESRRRDWRYSNYKKSYSIHECGPRAVFVPTLSEIKRAVKWAIENDRVADVERNKMFFEEIAKTIK